MKVNLLDNAKPAMTSKKHRAVFGVLASLVVIAVIMPFMPAAAAACNMTEDGNGDVIIAVTCEIAAGTYTITRDFIINAGITVTAQSNTGAGTGVIINAGRHITINSTATLTATGQGFTGNNGPGAGGGGVDGGGGAHGADGADPPCCSNGGLAYGSVTAPVTLGSGGGNTGATGGGAIKLSATAGTITINGTVSANGNEAFSSNQGGGAGGSIWIDAGTLAGAGGLLSAIGQNGNGWGGPGGGGRIAIYFDTDTSTIISGGNIQIFGDVAENWGAAGSSASGTIFIDDKNDALPNGDLILDNNNIDAVRSDTPQLTASQTYDNITVRKGADYRIGSGEILSVASGGTFTGGGTIRGHVNIDSGGTLTVASASTTISSVDITNNGTFNPPGATMTVSGSTFANGGAFNTVTALTVTGTSTFTHTGSFPATVTALTVTGTSSYTHSGTGMSITNGANFTLSASSTFTHSSSTGFGSGLDISFGAGTFNANNDSLNNLNSLTLLSGGTFSVGHVTTVAFATITVQSGGNLTHNTNTTTKTAGIDITATTIDIQTGGNVNIQGKGFAANSGTGAGGSGTDGGGGAHGGDGADPPCCSNGGLAYGSVTQPTTLGSGGGNTGGAGGGAAKFVVSGTMTINGTINANGVEPTSGMLGGGAGGGIWIDADTLAGVGAISADGENGNGWGGPGGGGRIAVYYNTDSSTLISSGTGIHAYGAVAENWGTSGSSASGTIFIDDKNDALLNGNLILDNNNIDAIRSDTPQLTASQTYDNLTIRKGVEYRIGSGETLALASGGTLTTGGTARAMLIIDSGGVFTLPSTLSTTLANIDVTNNGTFNPPGATMTVSGSVFTNAGAFNAVTNLTVSGTSTFTHTGSFPATVTALTVTGTSNYTHSGTGMSITSGANFTLSGSSTFTHNSATGFATGLDLTYGSGTFIAQHTSFTNQNSLTLQSGGVFQQNHTSLIAITTLTVQSGGSLTHGDNTTSHLYSVNVSSTTIDLQTGSIVNVQGKGFDANSGTGAGGSGTDGGGGAHGADGADPPCCSNGGAAYGSLTAPVTLGSGGGNTGGAGGGAVKLIATGTLTINTTINTKGNTGASGTQGGGAGGSIWIDAGTLAGSGTLSADGENGSTWGGPGAGGRIALYYNTDSSTIISSGTNVHAYGDTAVNWGAFGSSASGTVFIDDKNDALPNGDLFLDNNNIDAGERSDTPQLAPANQTFDNITIKRGAVYRIGSGETLALASGGTFTTGGTALPQVIIDSGGTFTLPASLSSTLSGINITNNGTFNPPSATMTFSGSSITNGGSFNAVTSLTVTGSTFTHTGNFPATLTNLSVAGGSTYTHQGTGMSITSGTNFTLSGSSTFTYNSATGFATGLDLTYGSGTFIAQHTSFTNQNSLTLQSGGVFQQNHMSPITITTLTVQSGGSLTHGDNTTSHLYSVNISSTTIDLQTGSIVNLQGRGFDANSGTGAGGSGTDGGGGAHGADGADPPCCTNGGLAYGSITSPTTIGSGGGNTGGAGGGAVKLVATGTLTINTTINTKGNVGPGGTAAGGAGGSIWIDAGTLAGSGILSADGENGSTWGGPGAGGRIAVYYNTDSSTLISGGNVHAYGDTAVNWGAFGSSSSGTVFIDDKDDAFTNGNLILDNNDVGSGARSDTPQIGAASQTYDNITIRKGATYRIGSGETLALVSGGTFTTGGTGQSGIIIDSGGTFDTNKATMSLSGLDVTLSGTFTDTTNLTYADGTFRNNTVVGSGLSSLTLGSGANWIQTSTTNPFSGSDLVVQNGGVFTQDNTSVITVTNVTVESGGTITHDDNTTTRTAYVNMSTTTFNVQTGGVVTANALGYDSSEGSGQPAADSATAGGAGYCGVGGNASTPGTGGPAYGTASNPNDLGSGGGDDTNVGGLQGGSGGGQITLVVSGTLTVAGTISANGANGTANEGGGGSGGTVNLTTDVWTGNGTITANGGGGSPTTTSTVGGGGGSGGRVHVSYGSKTFSGSMTAIGGNKGGFGGSSPATAGTTCSADEVSTGNPVPATTSISPNTKNAGEGTFTLTVNGSDFITTSVVRFQGSDRSTTFVNAGQITAQILAADIATGGTFAITVFNPSPGGGTSNSQTLTVNNAVPTTTSISPTSADRNGPGFTMTVNGTNFVTTSVVRFNGSDRTTNFISSVQLTATIPSTDLATAGSFPITVFNPTPAGGTSNSQTFTVTTSSSTTGNKVTLSRLKAGATGTADIAFVLQNTLSSPLTVTFPAGFTVLSAATGGSACLSNFGFTSSTLTASKTNCSGSIIITGATVQNPATPGVYYISWVNDDPGGASVIITSDDQANVSAAITPTITFNIGSQAAATACDGSFAGNGGAVPLGALTVSSVSTSDVASIPHICARLTTDASSGAAVAVRSANGALASVAAPSDTIASSTTTLTPGTAGYGLCVGSAGGDTGKTDPAGGPASAAPVRTAPFNGSCSTGSHAVGGLTASFQNIWTVATPSLNAFARIYVKASISPSTAAHADYTDTLTFIVTGTY